MLVCGLETRDDPATAEDDVHQIMRIVSVSVGASADGGEDAAATLVDSLLDEPSDEIRQSLLSMPRGDGEELYSFAKAIELVLLRQKQGKTA